MPIVYHNPSASISIASPRLVLPFPFGSLRALSVSAWPFPPVTRLHYPVSVIVSLLCLAIPRKRSHRYYLSASLYHVGSLGTDGGLKDVFRNESPRKGGNDEPRSVKESVS